MLLKMLSSNIENQKVAFVNKMVRCLVKIVGYEENCINFGPKNQIWVLVIVGKKELNYLEHFSYIFPVTIPALLCCKDCMVQVIL